MLKELMCRYPELEKCKEAIEEASEAIITCYENGGKLLICGNGGSASDSDHIVGELMKGFLKKRPLSKTDKEEMIKNNPSLSEKTLSKLQKGLPAVSLTSLSVLNSAFCNDVDPELIYAQGVLALGKEGDILIAISTSGNAINVNEAAKIATSLGVKVIALTGKTGGKLKEKSDILVMVPENETFKIQELHLPVYHYLCAAVEEHFFEE